MGKGKSFILVAFFVILIAMETAIVRGQGNGNGNGNNGNGNGNGNNGSGNGNGNNGSGNGNGNNGSGNGNGNNGSGNGNGNNGNGNGNGNNGNGNNGSGNGNGNNGSGNGNGNNGSGNGNGNNGNGNVNGNGNNGHDNGLGNNGNGNGNGNNGNGNGNGNNGNGNGNGNNGNGNGNGNNGNGNGNGNNANGKGNDNGKKKPKKPYDETTDYDTLTPLATGQERAFCKAKSGSGKCEATCKLRKPKCDGYGSLCYDPRFVGGDGVMFYFHGAKDGNFAIVSDENLHINAHFIGNRPQGRTRDFTWVQALSVMFNKHTLVIAASRVSHWDDRVDSVILRWDGETINVPTDGEAEWKTNDEERQVIVERTDDTNSVKVTVSELVELNIRVRPIGEEENRVHNYQIPAGDAFAHLETQFKFFNLSDLVEGVLGKTYRPEYVSPVKRGVHMPMMGGEDKYQTPSLFSPLCKVCRFQRQSAFASNEEVAQI
ncbi:Root cap/late embryogenesis-like protein [Quillaja saponaria]|uniref:Root cap/late embryogenesis-like protein n=1 Tax=Quillaja saponaria TaxID=32244 RepID=A0AAD7QGC4_QUISA|nr:Root cap/late embryogenesis-like protein [Quillaja saponaria]